MCHPIQLSDLRFFSASFLSPPLSQTCQLHPDLRAQTPQGLHIPDMKVEAAKYKLAQQQAKAAGQMQPPPQDGMDMSN
jgi:hypothetical protein